MNPRDHPHRPRGVRWTGLRLVVSLCPGIALAISAVATERNQDGSRAYLGVIGSMALRFAEAIPLPEPTVSQTAGPPLPAPIEAGPREFPQITEHSPPISIPAVVAPPAAPPEPLKDNSAKWPQAILPDDTRPKVRAEDFLPFFQFPGSSSSAGDVTVVVPGPAPSPSPGALPTSSASYRQL